MTVPTDQIIHGVRELLDAIAATPPHMWYAAGVVIASLPVTVAAVELYKRHHFKVNASELTNHAIDFVVTVTAGIMALADFLIANGTNLAHLFPFLLVVLPTIKAFAPSVYTYSKAVHSWMVNRKHESQTERLQAAVQAATNLPPINTPPPKPSPDLLQL